MEQSCPKKNVAVCVAVLAMLNLAVVVLAAKLSTPLFVFDDTVESFNKEVKPIYDQRGSLAGYRFQSCAQGSVNCHAKGNLAGL